MSAGPQLLQVAPHEATEYLEQPRYVMQYVVFNVAAHAYTNIHACTEGGWAHHEEGPKHGRFGGHDSQMAMATDACCAGFCPNIPKNARKKELLLEGGAKIPQNPISVSNRPRAEISVTKAGPGSLWSI